MKKKKEKSGDVVFPCVLRILPNCVFNKRDPIVVGCVVEEGILKIGTPICVPEKDNLPLGKVISIEANHKSVESVRKGAEVAVKIQPHPNNNQITYGRHFDLSNKLYSKITRESIDTLKEFYRDEMTQQDWKVVVGLKKLFAIQ